MPNDNIVKSAYLYKKIEERKLKKYLELKKCLMGVYDENNITSEEKNKYKKKIEGKYTTAQREIKKLEDKLLDLKPKEEAKKLEDELLFWQKREQKYANLNNNEDIRNANLLQKRYRVLPYSPALLSDDELTSTLGNYIHKIKSTERGKEMLNKAYSGKDDKITFFTSPEKNLQINEYQPASKDVRINLDKPKLIQYNAKDGQQYRLMNQYMQVQGRLEGKDAVLVEKGFAELDNTIFHESGHKLQYTSDISSSHGKYESYITKNGDCWLSNTNYETDMKKQKREGYWPALRGDLFSVNEHDNIASWANNLSENFYRMDTATPIRDSYVFLGAPFYDTKTGILKDALFFQKARARSLSASPLLKRETRGESSSNSILSEQETRGSQLINLFLDNINKLPFHPLLPKDEINDEVMGFDSTLKEELYPETKHKTTNLKIPEFKGEASSPSATRDNKSSLKIPGSGRKSLPPSAKRDNKSSFQ